MCQNYVTCPSVRRANTVKYERMRAKSLQQEVFDAESLGAFCGVLMSAARIYFQAYCVRPLNLAQSITGVSRLAFPWWDSCVPQTGI